MIQHLRIATFAAIFVAVVVAHTPSASAQQTEVFGPERLEQLVAPIALYPDSLLTQVLMAATYPLEVVEAARWVQRNPGLSQDALADALRDTDWDPSVKSLCPLPDVLNRMNDNLDWTQDLGDAFLAQQADLLAAVQRMRNLAYDCGNLRSTEQQRVVVQDRVVVIQPAAPEVVYVPVYSPRVVYGASWGYPSYYYPSFYVAPPPGYALLSFGIGVAIGAALWADCDWGHWHDHGYYGGRGIFINRINYDRFNRRTNRDWHDYRDRDFDDGWHHDPGHRRGVNYRSPELAQRYGAPAGSSRVTRDQARDFGAIERSREGSRHDPGARREVGRDGGGARRDLVPRPGAEAAGRERPSRREMAPVLGAPGGRRDGGQRGDVAPHRGAPVPGGSREIAPHRGAPVPGSSREIAPHRGAPGPGSSREIAPRPGGPGRGSDGGPRREFSAPPSASRGQSGPGDRVAPRPGMTGRREGQPSSRDFAPRSAPPGSTLRGGPAREVQPDSGMRGGAPQRGPGARGPSGFSTPPRNSGGPGAQRGGPTMERPSIPSGAGRAPSAPRGDVRGGASAPRSGPGGAVPKRGSADGRDGGRP